MDKFDPAYTPNTSDLPGKRYCFGRQYAVGAWNLQRLAESLSVLIPQPAAESVLAHYQEHFLHSWKEIMKRKFGFTKIEEVEQSLFNEWYELMQDHTLDLNERFRSLGRSLRDEDPEFFIKIFADTEQKDITTKWRLWYEKYLNAIGDNRKDIGTKLCQVNPRVILRNHLLHRVIESTEKGDHTLFLKVNEMIQRPFDDWDNEEDLLSVAPDWALEKNVAMNSCSS